MIIELSKTLGDEIRDHPINPFLEQRMKVAEIRIKIQIGVELYRIGVFAPTDAMINKVYDGIPDDAKCVLIAHYC